MEVHKVFNADTGILINTFSSQEEVLAQEQQWKQKQPTILLLKRQDQTYYDDDAEVYFLFSTQTEDMKEEEQRLEQPLPMSQLVPKPPALDVKHPDYIKTLSQYYADILNTSLNREKECKQLKESSLLRRDAIRSLVNHYLKLLLKETSTFCETFLPGGTKNVITALKSTKCTQSESHDTLMSFLSGIDPDYSEEGLNNSYKTVQEVLNTSRTTIEMQQPAFKFCQGRINDYSHQVSHDNGMIDEWRQHLFDTKNMIEKMEIAHQEFETHRITLEKLIKNRTDSSLLVLSAIQELEQSQIEKRLLHEDDRLREELWKCMHLASKENARIKMIPMMKLRTRMAQFLAMLDGVYQTVHKALVNGALLRIKFAYHLPSIYSLMITEVLRRREFKSNLQIDFDQFLARLEKTFVAENEQRTCYKNDLKLKMGSDSNQKEILDSLVSGLMDKIQDSEIIKSFKNLKSKLIDDLDIKLLQVDPNAKEECEFVFIDEEFQEAKSTHDADGDDDDANVNQKRNVLDMATNMGATLFFNEVNKQGKQVKEMIHHVNQKERIRRQEQQARRATIDQQAQFIKDDDDQNVSIQQQPSPSPPSVAIVEQETISLEKHNEKIRELESELDRLRSGLNDLEMESTEKLDRYQLLTDEQSSQIHSLNQSLELLKKESHQSHQELLKNHHQELNSLQKKHQVEFENKVDDLTREYTRQLSDSKQAIENLQSKSNSISQFKSRITQLESTVEHLNRINESTNQDWSNDKKTIEKLMNANKNSSDDLTLEKNKVEHLTKELEMLKSQNERHESEAIQLSNQIKNQKALLVQSNSKISNLDSNVTDLKSQVSSLHQELSTQKEINLDLQHKITNLLGQPKQVVQPLNQDYESKIQQLSELVSNSSKVISNLNSKVNQWEKVISHLKKQFTVTMTTRMSHLTDASRELSEAQAKVNQSGTSYQRQQKIFRLNLIQQGKIVKQTIAEYVDVMACMSSVSPLIGDLIDFAKQSLGDLDQIMTQCEIMCREELEEEKDDSVVVSSCQHHQGNGANHNRSVVVSGFSVDDKIVFFRSQNEGLWEAFNIDMPNYFLSPEAVMSLKSKKKGQYDSTHVAIGLAVEIEKCNCPENASNPLNLRGPYHIVTAVLD
ncbi:myosin [Acrasis kona]|uniref:Myosin n=1 Tax=Acrasis kona TaxID=1008807 RepID=A0AAW2YLL9_9EUKA